MKSLVLDTNILIAAFEHGYKLPDSARAYDRVILPATVIGEYRAGITDSRQGRENAQKLETYMGRATVESVPMTNITAEYYAKVFQTLKAKGQPIPQNDMWIAASALEHGADIDTYDPHFRFIPMLTVLIPE